jgi:hypothetical protein
VTSPTQTYTHFLSEDLKKENAGKKQRQKYLEIKFKKNEKEKHFAKMLI